MRVRCPNCDSPLTSLPYPPSTVDAIVESTLGHLILVRRRFEPLGWALPGGFVDTGESLEEACRREIDEETGLVAERLRQLHTYSDPARDPRHHTITTVFVCLGIGTPQAGDDAAEVKSFSYNDLPDPLCFDHAEIIQDYLSGRWGISPSDR